MKKKEVKRHEAEERNAQWAALAPEEQLAHLDRLGLRALKQREKIAIRLRGRDGTPTPSRIPNKKKRKK